MIMFDLALLFLVCLLFAFLDFDFTVLRGTVVQSEEICMVLTVLPGFFWTFLCVEWLMSIDFSGMMLLEMSQFFPMFFQT